MNLLLVGIEECYPFVHSRRAISVVEKLLKAGVTQNSVTLTSPGAARTKTRSLMELDGLGAVIWEGVDPMQYVAGLRDEWHDR